MNLEQLYKIIQDRKKQMPKNSYTASLFQEGKDRIIQKVGEEAVEVVIAAAKSDLAAKNESKKEIISEMADLWFHCLVLLTSLGITPTDIFEELEKRREN